MLSQFLHYVLGYIAFQALAAQALCVQPSQKCKDFNAYFLCKLLETPTLLTEESSWCRVVFQKSNACDLAEATPTLRVGCCKTFAQTCQKPTATTQAPPGTTFLTTTMAPSVPQTAVSEAPVKTPVRLLLDAPKTPEEEGTGYFDYVDRDISAEETKKFLADVPPGYEEEYTQPVIETIAGKTRPKDAARYPDAFCDSLDEFMADVGRTVAEKAAAETQSLPMLVRIAGKAAMKASLKKFIDTFHIRDFKPWTERLVEVGSGVVARLKKCNNCIKTMVCQIFAPMLDPSAGLLNISCDAFSMRAVELLGEILDYIGKETLPSPMSFEWFFSVFWDALDSSWRSGDLGGLLDGINGQRLANLLTQDESIRIAAKQMPILYDVGLQCGPFQPPVLSAFLASMKDGSQMSDFYSYTDPARVEKAYGILADLQIVFSDLIQLAAAQCIDDAPTLDLLKLDIPELNERLCDLYGNECELLESPRTTGLRALVETACPYTRKKACGVYSEVCLNERSVDSTGGAVPRAASVVPVTLATLVMALSSVVTAAGSM